MRTAILFLAPLVAACGGGGGNETAPRAPRAAVQTAELTGLYDGRGTGSDGSRICMVSEGSGLTHFGLVIETPDGSCSGAGQAVRSGDRLRLTMAGDEQCVIEAQVRGTRVTFPSSVAPGCTYYCAPGSTLAGRLFEKTGGAAEDAMRATDLAGSPLCG